MIPGDHGKHRVPYQDLLGKAGKNVKDIDNWGKPEPDLESDRNHFLEVTEEHDEHREKESKGVRKDLLYEIQDRYEKEVG